MANSNTGFHSETFLKRLTHKPGVYQMLDARKKTLYVGKARDLKKRVTSYYRPSGLDTKTMTLVNKIHDIQITVTHSETEALLLEQNLIKSLKPPFNIVFRDDKSYPYIYMTSEDKFPSLKFYRGRKPKKGRLFGPYPSSSTVRDSLVVMQKLFGIRHCDEHFFKQRTRACLQHQIGRCSAPCVNLIDAEAYQQNLRYAVMLLEGKGQKILSEFQKEMDQASERLDFETAARHRDKIRTLNQIQENQDMVSHGDGHADIIVVVKAHAATCITVFFVRDGRVLGQKNWFPKDQLDRSLSDVLSAFLPRLYLKGGQVVPDIPKDIITNTEVTDSDLLVNTLTELAGRKVRINSQPRGQRARWRDLAITNAKQILGARLDLEQDMQTKFVALQAQLQLPSLPTRLECFDISHISGTSTVASCVVFGPQGPIKEAYRRFNIAGIQKGDDYAAMHQALHRHYSHAQATEGINLPEVLFVDGGKGQVSQARAVLAELQIDGILIVGVAKGAGRKPGLEKLIIDRDNRSLHLAANDPALQLVVQIRDEAHRFAITGHRRKRSQAMQHSKLEGISGIGAGRRRALLKHFGGLPGVQRASAAELAKTPGISRKLADNLYQYLHTD